jgi:hypothetical protein
MPAQSVVCQCLRHLAGVLVASIVCVLLTAAGNVAGHYEGPQTIAQLLEGILIVCLSVAIYLSLARR